MGFDPNNRIKKGPSVDEVRLKSGDGKVKTEQVLVFGANKNQMSVEDARAAMISAGEAPRGDSKEARGGYSSDSQTRWQKSARPSSIPIAQSVSQTPAEVPAPDGGYLIRFTYSDGNQETFEVANRVQMIREVKRRQAVLMAKGLKAEVEIAEIGSDEAPVTTEIGAGVENKEKISADGSQIPAEPAQRGQGGSTTTKEPAVEKMENSKFVLEICQEDGEWVGRITYKNGAGTEEFRADTRKALDMKLLEGKAHATLKVREVLRRDTYYDDLDKVYDIPDYTQEEFEELKPETQGRIVDSIAGAAALQFRNDTPEFYGTKFNIDKIMSFLHKRNLPVTVKNLKYAFEELVDDLEQRPMPKVSVPETPAPVVATVAADSAPTPAPIPTIVSTVPAQAAAPTTEVRKRGSFGFKPGFVSSFDETVESGKKTNEPSEKDVRNMPLEELAKQVRKNYNRNRQF
jgi:hypothetical protein